MKTDKEKWFNMNNNVVGIYDIKDIMKIEPEKQKNYWYKQNDIILLTKGEYSYYQHICLFKVLKDFDIRMIVEKDEYNDVEISPKKGAELEANGIIKEINFTEINVNYDINGKDI